MVCQILGVAAQLGEELRHRDTHVTAVLVGGRQLLGHGGRCGRDLLGLARLGQCLGADVQLGDPAAVGHVLEQGREGCRVTFAQPAGLRHGAQLPDGLGVGFGLLRRLRTALATAADVQAGLDHGSHDGAHGAGNACFLGRLAEIDLLVGVGQDTLQQVMRDALGRFLAPLGRCGATDAGQRGGQLILDLRCGRADQLVDRQPLGDTGHGSAAGNRQILEDGQGHGELSL
ncbi:MAG TPA: hypothetical protein PLZ13_17535, partial [Ottowia sp.]|nr:hypothetical protein [Ottowia sp.]